MNASEIVLSYRSECSGDSVVIKVRTKWMGGSIAIRVSLQFEAFW